MWSKITNLSQTVHCLPTPPALPPPHFFLCFWRHWSLTSYRGATIIDHLHIYSLALSNHQNHLFVLHQLNPLTISRPLVTALGDKSSSYPGFLRRGGGANLLFWHVFSENCIQLKKVSSAHLDPPMKMLNLSWGSNW